eukprot:UN10923
MIHRNLYISKILPMNTRNEKNNFVHALSKVATYSNDVYYRKIFWFRCCLRTNYSGIFR